ncbi:hypothetical protein AGLY_002243 [Aphis glycines]|uniref:Uncharacterized protein n=1 Tax=Aphis glycines TaxID=307491 RepID=A0A6G0U3C9_APHGL|nr:hypothetical protein AGLY_002243 [Aphis glycines]
MMINIFIIYTKVIKKNKNTIMNPNGKTPPIIIPGNAGVPRHTNNTREQVMSEPRLAVTLRILFYLELQQSYTKLVLQNQRKLQATFPFWEDEKHLHELILLNNCLHINYFHNCLAYNNPLGILYYNIAGHLLNHSTNRFLAIVDGCQARQVERRSVRGAQSQEPNERRRIHFQEPFTANYSEERTDNCVRTASAGPSAWMRWDSSGNATLSKNN